MPPVGERHAQDRISWLQNREINLQVSLRPGVGLNVCSLRTEEYFGTLDSQCFDHVNKLATAIIASARISLGVLVCQD